MEFYPAERKKDLIPFATAWMELESIMLSDIQWVLWVSKFMFTKFEKILVIFPKNVLFSQHIFSLSSFVFHLNPCLNFCYYSSVCWESTESFFPVFFRLDNFCWSVFMLTDVFFHHLSSDSKSVKWISQKLYFLNFPLALFYSSIHTFYYAIFYKH